MLMPKFTIELPMQLLLLFVSGYLKFPFTHLGIQFEIRICPLSFFTLINDGGIMSIMAFAFTIPKNVSNYELIDR